MYIMQVENHCLLLRILLALVLTILSAEGTQVEIVHEQSRAEFHVRHGRLDHCCLHVIVQFKVVLNSRPLVGDAVGSQHRITHHLLC